MKNKTLTFVQFYKANHTRRDELAKRYNFKSSSELMQYLKTYGSVTLGAKKTIVVNSYDAFKKLSRSQQLDLALKNGYSTIAAYMSKLRSQLGTSGTINVSNPAVTVTNTPVDKKTNILTVFVLDESSSMGGEKARAMFTGVKGVVEELKKHQNSTPGLNYLVGTLSFSDRVNGLEISTLDKVKVNNRIMGGMTALHDAVGKALNSIMGNASYKDFKKVVQIFTDGGENCSRKFSERKIAELIKAAEKEGITVTFMGTAGDVLHVNRMYSLREGNSIVHQNTADSIGQTFSRAGMSTISYSKSVIAGEDVSSNFYSKVLLEDKK